MRFHHALKALLVVGFLASPVALAGKKPTDFQPNEMTDEDFARAHDAKHTKLGGYDPGIVEEKPKEIPWLLLGLAGMCALIAAPFGISQYVRTAKEIKTSSGAVKSGMDETPN